LNANDLRGAARLSAEATIGLADLVEAMHERIARLPGMPAPPQAGRTRGITGLVYKTVRGVTRLVGGSLEALLGLLAPALAPSPGGPAALPTPEREAVVAALNGVLGDHLAATANPLATPMTFRRAGQPLVLEREALRTQLPAAGPQLLVLLHGLCMNDLQWHREGHDHGAALEREHGWTAVYLHYNTGLPIAANGLAFARLMQALTTHWPQPVQRLALLGHSMGGLVARSGVHQAAQAQLHWPARLDDLVFLGTPHHGAPLERAGHGIDRLLAATPYSAPLARLTRLRSAGINDLRQPARVLPESLPEGVRCSTVAGTLGATRGSLKGRVLGDGLVPLASALDRHEAARRTLAFAAAQQCIVEGTDHMALLSSTAVYAQLARWLGRANLTGP
jgi:pimeloyl-ACP methyl ester carboxylesterase